MFSSPQYIENEGQGWEKLGRTITCILGQKTREWQAAHQKARALQEAIQEEQRLQEEYTEKLLAAAAKRQQLSSELADGLLDTSTSSQ